MRYIERPVASETTTERVEVVDALISEAERWAVETLTAPDVVPVGLGGRPGAHASARMAAMRKAHEYARLAQLLLEVRAARNA